MLNVYLDNMMVFCDSFVIDGLFPSSPQDYSLPLITLSLSKHILFQQSSERLTSDLWQSLVNQRQVLKRVEAENRANKGEHCCFGSFPCFASLC